MNDELNDDMSDDDLIDEQFGIPDADPALAAAVLEIEAHIAESGWDQPARLYALVATADHDAKLPSCKGDS